MYSYQPIGVIYKTAIIPTICLKTASIQSHDHHRVQIVNSPKAAFLNRYNNHEGRIPKEIKTHIKEKIEALV